MFFTYKENQKQLEVGDILSEFFHRMSRMFIKAEKDRLDWRGMLDLLGINLFEYS